MGKAVDAGLVLVIALAFFYVYHDWKNGPHQLIESGQCFAQNDQIINGSPAFYIYKVTKSDENNYCRVQGDVSLGYFYGYPVCASRTHMAGYFSSITILECPPWGLNP